jgi:hypothetical protein
MTAAIEISRLHVRWRTDAELRQADRARLDDLVRKLCDGPLEDALTDIPGDQTAEVCIRRVVVPPHHARWGSADAELLTGWAGAIGRAVRATTDPAGDVVRFASRAHAQADLVVSVLAGDRERIWAWRLLGLWPAGTWTDAEAVSHTVAAAVAERPGALVALAVAAARAARLGRFTEYLGPAALTEFTGHAWRAAGGTDRPRPRAGQAGPADTAVTGRLAALLRQRSQIVAAALALPAARLAAPAGPDDAAPAASSRPPDQPAPPARPGPLAESLAALAVLEVEPAMAAHPAAWPAVAATARGLLAAADGVARPSSTQPAVGRPDPPGGAPADTGRRPGRPGDGPVVAARRPDPPDCGPARAPADDDAAPLPDQAGAQTGPLAGGGATPAPGAATSWGGLLFLLPVVSDLGIPASMTADPGDDSVGLRPILHELGRQLLARAAPDAEPPGAGDPALLAFCGLSPGSEPPGRPGAAATRRIGLAAGSVAAVLRERLTGSASHRGDQALLLGVCRRHAVIHADPGWIDVDLRLDEVDVDVRRAGLDLDPGYLPWLGCVVRFCYV